MKPEKERGKLLTRRAVLLAGGQLGLLGALAGRMYYLQVLQADRYGMLADENRISIRLLAPPRGRIVDRFGVQLAANQPTYRIVIVGEQANDLTTTLDAIGTLIPLSDGDRRRVMRDMRRKHSFVPVVVRDNLNWDEMSRVDVNTLELPGVSVEEGLTRYYPFGEAASHVVGYVAAVTEQDLNGDDPLLELPDFRIGKNGVEKSHDLELRGTAGTSQVEVNAFGRVVRELAREPGLSGQEVVLSLDMALQDQATRSCAAMGSAASVLLDAWTGEVLALASAPGYDPTAFSAGLTPALWKELISNPFKPLSDKAISGTYAPGSTFKPVVAMAALDAGMITPETRVTCPGHYALGNVVFHCWKKGGHGSVNLRDAIKHSCDVFFFSTARLLGIDRIAAMAKRFGLGAALGLDIPGELSGLMPTAEWKKAVYGVPWQQGETLSCGIGQSYITTTPLQLATMTARLVTGAAVVPKLVRDNGMMTVQGAVDKIMFPSLGMSEKDRKLVLEGMFAVVNEQGGTGYAARIREPGFEMGGKSGSAQVRHISEAEREHGVIKQEDLPWKDRDHALFIAFAPIGAPRYVCATIVEHGMHGASAAAPICHDLLLQAQQRDPVHKIPAEPFGAPATVAQVTGIPGGSLPGTGQ
jgi:penicillin-binding protein 2